MTTAFKKPIVVKIILDSVPDDMRKNTSEADKNCRSLSSQIIFMLRQQIEQRNDK